MLKYYDYAVTFSEFPDEVALCVNITNCPGMCEQCSEPWLRLDIGSELTNEAIQNLINSHCYCTVFGLMGGDIDHEDIKRIADYIHANSNMKVGFYSGMDSIDIDLLPYIDLYKIGRWIAPKGDAKTWSRESCGPLPFPFSNQLYFEKKDGQLVNATYKFRKNPLHDLTRYIIGYEKTAPK